MDIKEQLIAISELIVKLYWDLPKLYADIDFEISEKEDYQKICARNKEILD